MVIFPLDMNGLSPPGINPNAAYPCIKFAVKSPPEGEMFLCKYCDGFWQALYFIYRPSVKAGYQERSVHVPRKNEELHATQDHLVEWVKIPRWLREEFNL